MSVDKDFCVVKVSKRLSGKVGVYLCGWTLKQAGLHFLGPFAVIPDTALKAIRDLESGTVADFCDWQTPTKLYVVPCQGSEGLPFFAKSDWNFSQQRLALLWDARAYGDADADRRFRPQRIAPDHFQIKDGMIVIDLPSGIFEGVAA